LLSNTKLAVRLGVGFGVMLALLGVVGFFAVTRMNQLSNLNRQLYEHPFAVQRAVLAIDGNVIRMHRAMKDVALSRNEADFTSAVATVDELEKKTYDEFKIVEERFLGEPAMYIRAETLFKQWRPIRQEVIGLVRDGEYVEAAEITREKGTLTFFKSLHH
jgi:methyl-accepting chemotaxis protein